MTATLLIPLVGPLQSWGLDSRFDQRQTAAEPSKSGVIGMCCAALGRDRSEPIDDLAALEFGVRVDRQGRLSRDFHTARDVIGAGVNDQRTVVSNRWYLVDAAFLAGLHGSEALLRAIHAALQKPHWPTHLGRRSCPPTYPPGSGQVLPLPLEEALRQSPLLVPRAASYRLVLEDPLGPQSRPDQPLAPFSQRRFGMRRVRTLTISVSPMPGTELSADSETPGGAQP
jgi:CRISPR system Cascade subunit CasD